MAVEVLIALGSAAFAGIVFFWIWAMADCYMFEPKGKPGKGSWLAIIALGNIFGAVAYSIWRRPKRFEDADVEE